MALSGGIVKSRTENGSRTHLLAAAIAFLVSAGLHTAVLTQINSFPILVLPASVEPKRFTPIEMADVRLTPPEPVQTLETTSLDEPPMDLPVESMAPDAKEAIPTPEPVHLPLPALDATPVVSAPPDVTADLPPAVRQEVLAIQDRLVPDQAEALPRRWIEQDIPRIDQAPDIQLPVEQPVAPVGAGSFNPALAASFIEDMDAGTPDWSEVMQRRVTISNNGDRIQPTLPSGGLTGVLDENPDSVSSLKAIENLLQISVVGYESGDDPYLYVALQIEPVSDGILQIQPRDILFIQDSSESMTPWKLDECRRGLKRWLDFLNPGDRFEIMGFRDSTYTCFGEWKEYNETSRQQALTFIDGMRAVGDTDVYRSLELALSRSFDPTRTSMLILVTDGRPTVGVIGSSEIIEGITRFNRGHVSVFAVGGGKKVNSFFLDLMSYRNRGEAVVARGEEEIPAAMESWARQLQRPMLTDLSYTFSGVDASEIYPKQLTHLFQDRPLIIHGRFPRNTPHIVFQVVGRSGTNWHDMVFRIDREQITGGNADLRSKWAWQKVYHMIGDYLSVSTEEQLETIRTFAETYGLLVPYGFSRAMPKTGNR